MTWLAFFHGTQNNVAECIVCDLISCLQNPYRIAFEGWKKKISSFNKERHFQIISNFQLYLPNNKQG